MNFDQLGAARSELVARTLIAYEDGLYQVLELPPPTAVKAQASVRPHPAAGERPATPEEVGTLLAGFRKDNGR